MRIKKIHIQNYKSLVDFELDSPPPFCAFVGPNASGKSNIFEALEFTNYLARFSFETPTLFGGYDSILSFHPKAINFLNTKTEAIITFFTEFADDVIINHQSLFNVGLLENSIDGFETIAGRSYNTGKVPNSLPFNSIRDLNKRENFVEKRIQNGKEYHKDFEQFIDNFSRFFVGNSKLIRVNQSSNKLTPDASNLSQVIGRIFQDENKKRDFIEWVQILIPEFQNIEVKKSNIDGSFEFFIYEKSSNKPFLKHLISDGTYNILALMAAVYQSSEPQFLCIEEPENGLHPHAIQFLMDFFREKCEDEGHHIWLNTHSPTLVRCLAIDEIVLVNKIDGQTRAKIDFNKKGIDIKTDEAWLTNALGGGTLWSK